MAHTCACSKSGPAARAAFPVTAGETVGDVVRRHPDALAVMQRLGVNHCCGAGLTLAEAAAAGGVPLATLLAALGSGPDPS